jgi:hypothetical protein
MVNDDILLQCWRNRLYPPSVRRKRRGEELPDQGNEGVRKVGAKISLHFDILVMIMEFEWEMM